MNLLHLRYFYEVARTRSFTQSSKNLRVSQPAISKMVRLLESDLDCILIKRSKRQLLLTSEGEFVFERASVIFEESRKIKEGVAAEQTEFSGAWTIGVSDNIAIYLLPRPIGQFKEKNPRLQVGVFSGISSQIKEEVLQERCGFGVFYTPLKKAEPFDSRVLFETEFLVVIAKKNRWFTKSHLTISDLKTAKVPRIESRHSDYSSGFPAHFHSKRLGFTGRPWLEVNHHEVKKRLVLGGFGFSIMTRHSVEEEVRRGQLICVKVERKLTAPVYAVWKRGRQLDRISEAFLKDFCIHWESRHVSI